MQLSNHFSLLVNIHTVCTFTDCCVIEVFGGVCVCCPLVFEFSVGIGVFVIGLGQISFFFSSVERSIADEEYIFEVANGCRAS